MFSRLTKKRIKNLFFGFTGTAIHCPYCKSMHVITVGGSVIRNNDNKWDEHYEMKCCDCGSEALMRETWFKKE